MERPATAKGFRRTPPQLWLLARLGERAPTSRERLLEQLPVDPDAVAVTLRGLMERSLVADQDDVITLTASGRAKYERLVTARCAGTSAARSGSETAPARRWHGRPADRRPGADQLDLAGHGHDLTRLGVPVVVDTGQ
jgi:hypothetical protein